MTLNISMLPLSLYINHLPYHIRFALPLLVPR
jgi:hypothetical protein